MFPTTCTLGWLCITGQCMSDSCVALLSVLQRHAYCPVLAVPTAPRRHFLVFYGCSKQIFIITNPARFTPTPSSLSFPLNALLEVTTVWLFFFVLIRYQHCERACRAARTQDNRAPRQEHSLPLLQYDHPSGRACASCASCSRIFASSMSFVATCKSPQHSTHQLSSKHTRWCDRSEWHRRRPSPHRRTNDIDTTLLASWSQTEHSSHCNT
jgi:hypothetical protein